MTIFLWAMVIVAVLQAEMWIALGMRTNKEHEEWLETNVPLTQRMLRMKGMK